MALELRLDDMVFYELCMIKHRMNIWWLTQGWEARRTFRKDWEWVYNYFWSNWWRREHLEEPSESNYIKWTWR